MMNLRDKMHSDSRQIYKLAYDLKTCRGPGGGLNPTATGNDTMAQCCDPPPAVIITHSSLFRFHCNTLKLSRNIKGRQVVSKKVFTMSPARWSPKESRQRNSFLNGSGIGP